MRFRCLSLLLAATLLTACDNAPPAPPPPEAPPEEPEKPQRPTTQALLDGPRKTIPLQVIPFTMAVPESWEIKTRGGSVMFLEGPAIGGDAFVKMDTLDPVSGEIHKIWFDRAANDAKTGGQQVTVHDFGAIRAIERRKVPPVSVTAAGDPTLVEWRITYFVPAGMKYECFEISFFDLSADSYQKNEALFSDLLRSVKHDTSATMLPPR